VVNVNPNLENEELTEEAREDSFAEACATRGDQVQLDSTDMEGSELKKEGKKDFLKVVWFNRFTWTLMLTGGVFALVSELFYEVSQFIIGLLSFGLSWMVIDLGHKCFTSIIAIKILNKVKAVIRSEVGQKVINAIKWFVISKYLLTVLLAFIVAYLTQNHYREVHGIFVYMLSLGFSWMIANAAEVVLLLVKKTK